MNLLAAFGTGLLFGVGLILSGMTDPGKVIGFLDVAGAWDPSLGLVMAGAIGVALPGFMLARTRDRTFLGGALHLPKRRDIDHRLVGGSAVFGIGWGLAGFCPGPAIVTFGAGVDPAAVFVAAMLAGMMGFHAAERILPRGPGRQPG